jgi:rfaE bifunctional protein kinase chain/domain
MVKPGSHFLTRYEFTSRTSSFPERKPPMNHSTLSPAGVIEIASGENLTPVEIAAVLDNLSRASVAVIGDFCLDVYWMIASAMGEISLETGLLTQPVSNQKYSPGGAGNVVMNLLALEVSRIFPIGVIGDDPFGRELTRLLDYPQIDRRGLIMQSQDWHTHTYVKPHPDGKESNRIDFGNFNKLSDATVDTIFKHLEEVLPRVSVVLINHQVIGSLHNSAVFRERLDAVIRGNPSVCFILDSRGLHAAYPDTLHKLNAGEVMRECGRKMEPGEVLTLEELVSSAKQLQTRWKAPLVVTRGENGCLIFDDEHPKQFFGIQVMGRVDPVGAGDTFVSALAAIIATGSNISAAAFVANLAAAVTAQKLFQTGTASPTEVLGIGTVADYVYRPELAASPRHARHLDQSELEVISEIPPGLHIRHAIFDHDGTISTLRESWEQIMEPMMLHAILGEKFGSADGSLFHRVRARALDFIDKTTGIQTIEQMQGLVELVKEFECVPAERILVAAGYKEIFNKDLKAMVNRRLDKLAAGELIVDDFTIKGAVPFLKALSGAGVKLYLASGTDDADAKEEAARLGYAGYFTGGIFGSVGDVTRDAKKVVLERIMAELGGAFEQLATFGDGPVEMRETVKHRSYAVGVASDEIRRFGMNLRKRTRLIRAGAMAVVPDFSQWQLLWKYLRLPETGIR